jgi:hypothetical protein
MGVTSSQTGLAAYSGKALSQQTCRQIAGEVIASWKSAASIDAVAALAARPELRQYTSVVLDLAYEEYCLRIARGESIDAAEFCKRFPGMETSVRRQIELHELVAEHPELMHDVLASPWPAFGDEIFGYTVGEELGRGAHPCEAVVASIPPIGVPQRECGLWTRASFSYT